MYENTHTHGHMHTCIVTNCTKYIVARRGRHSGKNTCEHAAGEHLFSNTHLEEALKIQWAFKKVIIIPSIRQTNGIISASGRMKKRPVWRIWSRFRGNNPSPRLWWRCSVGVALTGSAGVHLLFFFFFLHKNTYDSEPCREKASHSATLQTDCWVISREAAPSLDLLFFIFAPQTDRVT